MHKKCICENHLLKIPKTLKRKVVADITKRGDRG
jgi:hypothetical protein